ncbi:MAG: gamma-glutamyltransferase [Chloroflexota bacterium]|nr:gamma-glutamyltransferase [Chloroflexota bacterium]
MSGPHPSTLPFHSFQRIATGLSGAVCTSQPLASGAGLEMLRRGGNAFDAAIAAAAVLAVVEPMMSHLGGDVFMVVYPAREGRTWALNGSGNAPREATPDLYPNGMPEHGPLTAAVPGAVHGWCEASRRWGSLPLRDLLQPAIEYARDGFPLGPRTSSVLREMSPVLAQFPYSKEQFLSGDTQVGAVLKQPGLARTLEAVAEGGAEAFYTGEVAREIVRSVREQGGVFSEEDLAGHCSTVQPPISTSYRGYEVHGQPPVSQGHILLQELNLVEPFDLAAMGPLTPAVLHVLIEAKKLAFADRHRYLADPAHVEVPVEWLLSKEYARERAGLIDQERANPQPVAGSRHAEGTDTTYLAAADAEGNAVSWIQSVFGHFGSGVVAGHTGVLLNNRMRGFTLEPGHPNVVAPLKRPAHTLNAYLVLRDGRPWVIGGTPGADYQVQTNLQIITHLIDFGMNVAEANDAPWWASETGNRVVVEDRMPDGAVQGLRQLGHEVGTLAPWGGGRTVQLIQRAPGGVLLASSDVRAGGHAAVW